MKKQMKLSYGVWFFALFLLLAAGGFLSDFKALGASPSENTSLPASEPADVSVTPKASDARQKPTKEEQNSYIVKAGQTLWEIAQENGVPVQTLMKVNRLSSSVIIEGQELIIQ
ncbi:LysM peptidoglycan-binding domain-containing protein [Erwinia sp. CPCC 100877]|nr:LysM peptidoglycan-binding domain-containing protein [Erwinia sp. CPCC 100877]